MAFVGSFGRVGGGRQTQRVARALSGQFVAPVGVQPVRHGGTGAMGGAPKMTLQSTAQVGMIVYAVFMSAGGVSAFLKTGSKASLISGVVAGIALLIAYVKNSLPAALVIAAALVVVFAIRFAKTGKMMPSGMLGIASLAFAALFACALFL